MTSKRGRHNRRRQREAMLVAAGRRATQWTRREVKALLRREMSPLPLNRLPPLVKP